MAVYSIVGSGDFGNRGQGRASVQFDVGKRSRARLNRARNTPRGARAHLSDLTEHDLDLSPYAARTYFWRWNNRKRNFSRNFLSDEDLKLALD